MLKLFLLVVGLITLILIVWHIGPWADMPDDENEGEEADNKEEELKHGTWRTV